MDDVAVRPAHEDDVDALYRLGLAAIDQSAAGHYDERQRRAWAARRSRDGHARMVRETTTLVAEIRGEPAGFASVAVRPVGGLQAGEVDQLFVDPRHGGRGVARALLRAVERAAAAAGLAELVTHASQRAVPVFEALGYRRVEVETVDLDGVMLTRTLMRRAVDRRDPQVLETGTSMAPDHDPAHDPAFAGFELSRRTVGEVSLRVRVGGSGPPLLLLHGYPQTHAMWGAVAAGLAEHFTVVAPDLRGYGGSTRPSASAGSETQGKRAMAADGVGLMRQLGFDLFDVAGHDRGGRVAYRMALDAPDAVRRITVLDVVPTAEVWDRADARFALGYWHWAFLAQPAPMPEALIGSDPERFFFGAGFGRAIRGFRPAAVADYTRAVRDPAVVHAMCDDYRAGATCDRQLDEADRAAGRRIAAPLQVLWGGRGALAAWYDTPAIWREWADDVTGAELDCGHFLPEELPGETLEALRAFHGR
jgi:haloacetate dehalogenase